VIAALYGHVACTLERRMADQLIMLDAVPSLAAFHLEIFRATIFEIS
jgi:hypothetical protein